MAGVSPTQNTLKHYRSLGYKARVTEHWNPFAKVRQDLFGFIDVVAVGNGNIIGVQATSWSNHAARKSKIMSIEEPITWCQSRGLVHLISWKKVKNRWTPRLEDMTDEILKQERKLTNSV